MSVSAFVRQRVFAEAGEKPRPCRRDYRPVADQQAMAQALALLGRWHIANNLNQLAWHANIGTLPVDGDAAARIDEAYAFVVELRGFVSDDLMGALKEAYAISLGTKCRQFLFSLSLKAKEVRARLAKAEACRRSMRPRPCSLACRRTNSRKRPRPTLTGNRLTMSADGGSWRHGSAWNGKTCTRPSRRRYLAISCGSKVDSRSHGTEIGSLPVSVSTVLRP